MKSKINSRLLIDISLFAIFVATFFLDQTGLNLHQWLGVVAGATAIYHLATHWKWIRLVVGNFMHKASSKTRLYSLVDGALLLGFFACIVTGLVMSTWLNLTGIDYPVWRVIHLDVSIATAGVTLLKIGLHWRWIVSTLRGRPQPKPVLRPVSVGQVMDRRGFLRLMGVTGVVTVVAISRAFQGLGIESVAQASSGDSLAQGNNAKSLLQLVQPTATSQTISVVSSTEVAQPTQAVEQATSDQQAATATEQPTATPIQDPATDVVACSVRCPNHCSFPGSCRRYTDANRNGRCDLGECL
jgi:hypothetical protein